MPTRTKPFRAFAILCAVVFFGVASSVSPVEAATVRSALLIANAAYPDSDAELPTPLADAKALGDALKQSGFTVEIVENLGKDAMQSALDRFTSRLEPGSVALVFFGGYGIQVGRKNYLIPVDARIWSETDVQRDGIAVDAVQAALGKRTLEAQIVILDASRRNPFERRFRSFSNGLAASKPPGGSLMLHSTATGSVVADSTASRSLFVTELAKQIGLSGQDAEQAFTATSEALSKATNGQQRPAFTSSLERSFAFDGSGTAIAAKPKPDPKPKSDPKPDPKPTASKPAESGNDNLAGGWVDPKPSEPKKPQAPAEKPSTPTIVANKDSTPPLSAETEAARDFDAAKGIGTKDAYESFLRDHPAGPLAAKARSEIARLEAAKQAAAERPPEPKPYSRAELARKNALDQRIATNQRDGLAYYERGQFHAQRSDAALAIADFDEAIRINPDNAEAFNNRCWMQAMANELQRALRDCDEALRLRPDYIDALDSRGLVNLKTGSFGAAVTDYDAALRLDSSHSSALYGRGVARRRLGQSAQAERDLVAALKLNPGIDKEFAQYGLR